MTHSQWELLFYAYQNKGLSVETAQSVLVEKCKKRGWLEEKNGILKITLKGKMKAEELIPFSVA